MRQCKIIARRKRSVFFCLFCGVQTKFSVRQRSTFSDENRAYQLFFCVMVEMFSSFFTLFWSCKSTNFFSIGKKKQQFFDFFRSCYVFSVKGNHPKTSFLSATFLPATYHTYRTNYHQLVHLILNCRKILNFQFSILNSQFSIFNFQFSILNSQLYSIPPATPYPFEKGTRGSGQLPPEPICRPPPDAPATYVHWTSLIHFRGRKHPVNVFRSGVVCFNFQFSIFSSLQNLL